LPPIRPCTMILVKDLVLKKLTNKIISDTDIHVEVGNARCRPSRSRRRRHPSFFHGPARGRLARARSGSLHTHRHLAVPGAVAFALPRAFFASRKGSPILTTARCFYTAS
jgi:hypothetical protein